MAPFSCINEYINGSHLSSHLIVKIQYVHVQCFSPSMYYTLYYSHIHYILLIFRVTRYGPP
jgi:hypothetical protein